MGIGIEWYKKIGFGILMAFTCSALIRFTLLLDLNKRVFNHKPGQCKTFKTSVDGSPYMEFVEEFGLTFISSGGFKKSLGSTTTRGKIFAYKFSDLNKTCDTEPYELNIVAKNTLSLDKFTPLGISTHVSNKRLTLYVVNGGNQSVEIFSYNGADNSLLHLQTIKDQLFTSLSDIAVVSAGKFFLTNMFYTNRKWTQLAEILFHLHIGSLLFYDGKKAEIRVKGLHSPNGLAIDHQRGYLYMGTFLPETVKSFKLERDLSLVPLNDMPIMSSVDQIFVDKATGDLWLAAHPVFHMTFMHFYKPSNPGPSHVIRVRFQESHSSWTITEPFANDGTSGFSAAASIVEHKNQMLIGSRLGKTICCQINIMNLA